MSSSCSTATSNSMHCLSIGTFIIPIKLLILEQILSGSIPFISSPIPFLQLSRTSL